MTARLGPALAVVVAAGIALAVHHHAGAAPQQAAEPRAEELYVQGCSSCHGLDGRGVVTDDGDVRGPTLERSGEAAAYYYLTTGRMPLANSDDDPTRKDPAYNPEEIALLVEYVAELGEGPALPDVRIAEGDLAEGGELFRDNCQACHSATGAGGALSYGRAAPSLSEATPRQVAAAMRVGPGEMPVFAESTLSDEDVDSIARYVDYLQNPDDRGGLALGRVGPIPEGFVLWVLGLGILLVATFWIGSRLRGSTE